MTARTNGCARLSEWRTGFSISFGGCGGSGGGGLTYTATGVLVANMGVQAEAEGLQVVDNVTLEFMQLFTS